MGILLSDIFDPRSIKLNLEGTDKEAVFAELVGLAAALRPEFRHADVLAAIVERENRMSTGIAPGLAIPHAFYERAGGITGAIGISRSGIRYDAMDGKPVYAVFMLITGKDAREDHLQVLNRICTMAQSEGIASIRGAKTPDDVLALLSRFWK
ncbi:MAG: PTS sugar transporter subunit IIA [Treponema sp.]|nr:PTS sugar transporter subunit IIA [Treponema sp.]